MKLEREQVLLRVYLRNTDKYGWWRSALDTSATTVVPAKLSLNSSTGSRLRCSTMPSSTRFGVKPSLTVDGRSGGQGE